MVYIYYYMIMYDYLIINTFIFIPVTEDLQ